MAIVLTIGMIAAIMVLTAPDRDMRLKVDYYRFRNSVPRIQQYLYCLVTATSKPCNCGTVPVNWNTITI